MEAHVTADPDQFLHLVHAVSILFHNNFIRSIQDPLWNYLFKMKYLNFFSQRARHAMERFQ